MTSHRLMMLAWIAVLVVAIVLTADTIATIAKIGLTGARPPLSVFDTGLRMAIVVTALGLLFVRRDVLERITLVTAAAAASSTSLFGLGMRSPLLFAFRLLSHLAVYALITIVAGRMISRALSSKRVVEGA